MMFRTTLQVVMAIVKSTMLYFELAQFVGIIVALSFLIQTILNLSPITSEQSIDAFLEKNEFYDLQTT